MKSYAGIALAIVLIFVVGCSGGKNMPTLPAGGNAPSDLAMIFDEPEVANSTSDQGNWSVVFAGQFIPDGNGGLELVEDRDALLNYNITKFVVNTHSLHYKIVQWVGNRLEVDVTLDNPTSISVYDVRIIFNGIGSNKVLNPDSYTTQFSSKISPYISYATDDPWRNFPIGPGASDTQKIIFEMNGSGIGFVIIASFPFWCEEPYEIHKINYIGELNDEDGGWASLSCVVEDHDWNLQYIVADLRVFTGSMGYMVPNPEQPDNFEVFFTNELLAVGGRSYIIWIAAKSIGSNFLCYNQIEIPVEGGVDPPIVTITTPAEDPYSTPERFTTVSGTITNFEGTEALIDVNGDQQNIPVVDNQFSEAIVLNVGDNFIIVSAEGPGGIGSDTTTINCTAHSADLWIRLTWDKNFADVDMYVTEPSGETCWYGHQISQSTGARIDLDDVDGYGPEHYYLSVAEGHTLLPGTYELDVHYYDRHAQTQPVLATMLAYKNDQYYGEWSHVMTVDNPLQAGPSNRRRGLISWWDNVADIEMP